MKSKIGEMANHLEFLGYSVKKLEKKGTSQSLYVAAHPKKWNLVFWEANPDLVMFQITIDTGKKAGKGMDECVNAANQKLLITKAYYYPVGKNVALKFEVYYPGAYSKNVFGTFIDSFLNDVRLFSDIDAKKVFF